MRRAQRVNQTVTGPPRPVLEQRLSSGPFDAAIIGGGIFGALLAVEGAARGQKVVLVERDDFGAGASFNSLRTIHGGLRYLQFLDFPRALMSNAQRLWWLRHFPDLVQPISCLMPLYGEGLRRPMAFRLAFLLARLLRLGRDAQGKRSPRGIIEAAEVGRVVPLVRRENLRGGALWTDAFMPQSHRVVTECLHWAEASGAVLANYTELQDAGQDNGGKWCLNVRDVLTGQTRSLVTAKVINAAGANVDAVAARLTTGKSRALVVPTLAFNLLLDRPPMSRYSIAAKPPGAARRTYFVHPFQGLALAGTGHEGVTENAGQISGVDDGKINVMLDDLNEALPGACLTRQDVRHVFWGILPGIRTGSDELLMRTKIVDHGSRDGAAGAWSVVGTKFTEAPFVARRTWDEISGTRKNSLPDRPLVNCANSASGLSALSEDQFSETIRSLYRSEWCCTPDDLLWRRTDLWMHEELDSRTDAVLAEMRNGREPERLVK